jgi:hypothetical protein
MSACNACGREVDPLEVFPDNNYAGRVKGILCLSCYEQSPAGRRMPTADEVVRLWGGKS